MKYKILNKKLNKFQNKNIKIESVIQKQNNNIIHILSINENANENDFILFLQKLIDKYTIVDSIYIDKNIGERYLWLLHHTIFKNQTRFLFTNNNQIHSHKWERDQVLKINNRIV